MAGQNYEKLTRRVGGFLLVFVAAIFYLLVQEAPKWRPSGVGAVTTDVCEARSGAQVSQCDPNVLPKWPEVFPK